MMTEQETLMLLNYVECIKPTNVHSKLTARSKVERMFFAPPHLVLLCKLTRHQFHLDQHRSSPIGLLH